MTGYISRRRISIRDFLRDVIPEAADSVTAHHPANLLLAIWRIIEYIHFQ